MTIHAKHGLGGGAARRRVAAAKLPANVIALSDDDAARLADMFRLLGDASRLRILMACLDDAASVGDIAAATGLSISLVSHHLRLLRAARLVRAQRRGKQVFYIGADDHIRCTVIDMAAHVREPADGLGDGPGDED